MSATARAVTRALLLGSCLSLISCAPTEDPELSELGGVDLVMQVTHLWDQAGGTMPDLPTDDLLDEDFVAVTDRPDHQVLLTADRVDLEIDDMAGDLSSEQPDSLAYVLSEGTAAGGRFLIWVEQGAYRAELTIYGSGIPVIESERGDLVTAAN